MTKTKQTIAVLLTSILVFTACGYTVDISGMPEEQKQHHEELLAGLQDEYANAESDEEKVGFAGEIAFQDMMLGKYGKAIGKYEEVLKSNPINFVALNNIAVMYKEVGDVKSALEYIERLYDENFTNYGVVVDTIELLIENEKRDEALGVLQAFAKYDSQGDNNYTQNISDLFIKIKGEQVVPQ